MEDVKVTLEEYGHYIKIAPGTIKILSEDPAFKDLMANTEQSLSELAVDILKKYYIGV